MKNHSGADTEFHDSVADLAVRYSREFYRHVSAMNNRGEPVAIQTMDEKWVHDGVFFRRTPVPKFYLTVDTSIGVATYAPLVEAVRSDPDFGPALGKMVGTFYSGSARFEVDEVVTAVASSLLSSDGRLRLDEEVVRQAVTNLRRTLTSKTEDLVLLVPLMGLRLDATVTLQPGVELVRFTDDEVSMLANAGLLKPAHINVPFLAGAEFYGARVTMQVPRSITEPGDPIPDVWTAEQAQPRNFGYISPARIFDIVEDVLSSLRLAGPGFLTAPGHITVSTSFLGGWSSSSGTRPGLDFPRGEYVLNSETATKVRETWNLLIATAGSGRTKKIPMIVLRRYNAAADRPILEDAAVDLVIAAEALLSSEMGKDRTELSYRMALRGSALLAKTGVGRRTSFQLLKAGYELRSRIAHGDDLPSYVKVGGDRGNVQVAEFIGELTDVLRIMIAQAIVEASTDASFGTSAYWDSHILGE